MYTQPVKKSFKPYSITIETKAEHDFISGFVNSSDAIPKGQLDGFDPLLNNKLASEVKQYDVRD